MKKILVILIAIFVLSGCDFKKDQAGQSGSEEGPLAIAEEKMEILNSPLEAILKEEIIILNNPEETYPGSTQIKIDMLKDSKIKVVIFQDNLPDDVLKKQEYELLLEQELNGNWKVVSKKLIREECWKNRSCKKADWK